MTSNRARWLVAPIIGVMAMTVGATPALAAGPAGVHLATSTTNYGAGFSTQPYLHQQDVGSASVTFTVPPDVSCHSRNDTEWLAPGIWVSDDEGMVSQFSGVAFTCNSGVLTIADVMCVNTGGGSLTHCDDSLNVNPGDRVVASLSLTGLQTYAAVHDLTTGGRVSVSDTPVGNQVGVFIGAMGPVYGDRTAVVTHVPTFSTIHFTKAQINGQYLGDWSPTRFNLATAGSTQVKTGALAGDGDGFTTTFHHN